MSTFSVIVLISGLLFVWLIRFCLLMIDDLPPERNDYSLGSRGYRQEPLSLNYSKRKFYSLLLNLFIFSIELVMIFFLILSLLKPKFTPSSSDDISDNINIIAGNLAEASEQLSTMQQALEARIEFVEDLKKQAEIAENVISLSEEQVNAVQAKINQELEASSGKNTIVTILVSAVFFVLGLIVPQIYNVIKRKRKNTPQKDNPLLIDNPHMYTEEEIFQLFEKVKETMKKQ